MTKIQELHEILKRSKYWVYFKITGGGSRIIPELLEQGGASSYFVGADIPYDTALWSPNGPCVSSVAISRLAADSLALLSKLKKKQALGVAISARLCYNGERPGRIHEAYFAFDGALKTQYNIRLTKPTRKEQEEELCEKFAEIFVAELLTMESMN